MTNEMTAPLRLLLDLLSPRATVAQSRVDGLDERDWALIEERARQHRLLPLLHWVQTRHRPALTLPAPVMERWALERRRSGLRSLLFQRELVTIHRLLDEAGIPHLPLKGAYLAFKAYPEAGLRPLRDLDILIPRDHALDAYQFLIDRGLNRLPRYQGRAEALLAEKFKHLPPLMSPGGTVLVEIHSHLFHVEQGHDSLRDLGEDPGFWSRAIRSDIAGSSLPFPGPIDMLLHLIVHSAYDHQFDNGPLLFADLAFQIERHPVDWSDFWRIARETGCARGADLALRMTERYWGPLGVDYGGARNPKGVPAAVLETAAELTLVDARHQRDVKTAFKMNSMGSARATLAFLADRVFRKRQQVAMIFPVDARSPRVFLYYPVMWSRLLFRRLPRYLKARSSRQVETIADKQAALDAWLR